MEGLNVVRIRESARVGDWMQGDNFEGNPGEGREPASTPHCSYSYLSASIGSRKAALRAG